MNSAANQISINIGGPANYTTGPEYDARVERIEGKIIVCFSREGAQEIANEINSWGSTAKTVGRSVRGNF